jgi:iron complex outermembrane receptor protein
VGNPLDNVARHNLTLSGRYRFKDALLGWEANAGVRGEAKRYAYTYELPGYVVADVGVGYTAKSWRAALTVRNLLDQR